MQDFEKTEYMIMADLKNQLILLVVFIERLKTFIYK